MNIHEHQAKQILKKYGAAVPNGIFGFSSEEIVEKAKKLNTEKYVLKAQIHAGGRGKAGGVKILDNIQDLTLASKEMLGKVLITHQTGPTGKEVKRLYVEESSNIKKEFYLSCLVDRASSKIAFISSDQGGMDIEEVAANSPEDLIKIYISPSLGLESKIITQAIKDANLNLDYIDELHEIISKLYKLFTEGDCDLVEVNPLAITNQGVSALDSKVSLDMNAIYRHDDFKKYEEEIPIPESEKFAKSKGLNFIKLDGNVGIIGNGAGLVMSTLDVVAEHGGKAANFCDIGGGAKAETVTAALEVLESEEEVTSVLINIFGGITRCDLVAEGIVEATKGKVLKWPLIVRLDGTNSKEGLEILSKNANEKIIISESMDDAAKAAVEGGK